MFSHLMGNLKPPDHPKYSDAVTSRARRMWVAMQERLSAAERDAAYNAWLHDGVIMKRGMFGHWEIES